MIANKLWKYIDLLNENVWIPLKRNASIDTSSILLHLHPLYCCIDVTHNILLNKRNKSTLALIGADNLIINDYLIYLIHWLIITKTFAFITFLILVAHQQGWLKLHCIRKKFVH